MYSGQIVERGPAGELTQRPAHPYTQLLVASVPNPANLGAALRTGPGGTMRRAENAEPAADGCSFSPRCPFADDRCRREVPALRRISPVRAAACWHLEAAAPEILAGPRGGRT